MVNVFGRAADHDRVDGAGPVVILGLGRFGQSLGEELVAGGVEVMCVDADPRVVQECSTAFDHVASADTTNPTALRQLGVAEAGRVVIAIGSDIEASLLTASAVVDMGVPSIWAKADNAAHAKILGQIGVHHVVRPEADTGRRVAHLIGGRVQDYLEFDRGFAVAKIAPPVGVLDHRVGEVNARGDSPVQILAIRPKGGAFRRALSDDVIRSGDLVIAAGPVDELEKFASRR